MFKLVFSLLLGTVIFSSCNKKEYVEPVEDKPSAHDIPSRKPDYVDTRDSIKLVIKN